jgi:hypothetical protein
MALPLETIQKIRGNENMATIEIGHHLGTL